MLRLLLSFYLLALLQPIRRFQVFPPWKKHSDQGCSDENAAASQVVQVQPTEPVGYLLVGVQSPMTLPST